MSWWEALVLGIIQGLTEFLPVSSSGHLEIGQALFGTASEENLTFAIVVHTATVLATIVILWREIVQLLRGTFCTIEWNQEKDYVAKILVSMIPVFIIGMFFKDEVEAFFGNGLLLVGICLLVTACLLYLSEWLNKRLAQKGREGHEVTYRDAFVIGLAQFSFLMVLVPILGEAFLDLLDLLKGELTSTLGLMPLLVGFVAAFATGCFACKFMLNIVRKQKLIYFAIYCLCAGAFAICWHVFA